MRISPRTIHTWSLEFLASTTEEEQDVAIHVLYQLEDLCDAVPEVRPVLADVSISIEERLALLSKHAAQPFSQAAVTLLERIIQAQAFDALSGVLEQIARIREQHGVAREVTVTTALPLISSELETLQVFLKRLWKTRVIVHERVDASILGGVHLQANDGYVDATVRGRTHRLAEALLSV